MKRVVAVIMIGVFLIVVGLISLFAGGPVLYSPGVLLYFQLFGKTLLGLTTLCVGLLTVWAGWTRNRFPLILAAIKCGFWASATVSPLWLGNTPTEIFGITFKGPINLLATTCWLLVFSLCSYYYFIIGVFDFSGNEDRELLKEMQSWRK